MMRFRCLTMMMIMALMMVAANPSDVKPPIKERSCINAFKEYAWTEVSEVLELGDDHGVLVIVDNQDPYCYSHIDTMEMMPITFEPDDRHAELCEAIKRATAGILFNGTYDGETNYKKDKAVKWMLGFGDHLYYRRNGDHGTTLKPHVLRIDDLPSPMNAAFNLGHERMMRWVQRHLTSYRAMSYQIIGVSLIRTVSEQPRYPSFLRVLDDSRNDRVIKYEWVHPDNHLNTSGHEVGITHNQINDLYMENYNVGSGVLQPIAFFKRYYARFELANVLKRTPKFNLDPRTFPILPAQIFAGCPVNLCWSPVVDEILYYAGAYYLFQGRWMFRAEQGNASAGIVSVDERYDLTKLAGIDFRIQAAYVDHNYGGAVALVRKKPNVKHSHAYSITLWNLTTTAAATRSSKTSKVHVNLVAQDPSIEITFEDLEDGVHILTATMFAPKSDDAEPERNPLWIAFAHPPEAHKPMHIRSFLKNGQSYRPYSHPEAIPLKTLSAMFTDGRHLFLLSGFFIYVYQTPAERFESLCSVTYAPVYFNCTGHYDYSQIGVAGITSSAKLFAKAYKSTTPEELLPGKCNFYHDDWPKDGRIPFEPKKIHVPPDDATSWYMSEPLWMVMAVTGGVLLTIIVFYVYSWFAARRKRASGAHRIASKQLKDNEARVKAFLRDRRKKNVMASGTSFGSGSAAASGTTGTTGTTPTTTTTKSTAKMDNAKPVGGDGKRQKPTATPIISATGKKAKRK